MQLVYSPAIHPPPPPPESTPFYCSSVLLPLLMSIASRCICTYSCACTTHPDARGRLFLTRKLQRFIGGDIPTCSEDILGWQGSRGVALRAAARSVTKSTLVESRSPRAPAANPGPALRFCMSFAAAALCNYIFICIRLASAAPSCHFLSPIGDFSRVPSEVPVIFFYITDTSVRRPPLGL